jgi:hypothetical protein
MFHRDFNALSPDQLREYASQLERKERDIRDRAEVREGQDALSGARGRDLVLERLVWLLARVGARRRALSAQTSPDTHSHTPASRKGGTSTERSR